MLYKFCHISFALASTFCANLQGLGYDTLTQKGRHPQSVSVGLLLPYHALCLWRKPGANPLFYTLKPSVFNGLRCFLVHAAHKLIRVIFTLLTKNVAFDLA